MDFNVEFEQEDDGRWIAEIAEIPGRLPGKHACLRSYALASRGASRGLGFARFGRPLGK